ncbi:MAG: hypothetical protein HY716_05215 [Planctomycetes bacterium]|nr:hypothetical protein [Planctomycetota bacterium]
MDLEQDQLRKLIDENRRLKQRLFELEQKEAEQDTHHTKVHARETTQVTQVLKLLEQRDHNLEAVSAELHQKTEELARLNEQLRGWIAALSMYQQLVDAEPHPILGFNRDARLVLYNRAAVEAFGPALPDRRLRDVEDIDFSALDPYLPLFVRELLKSGRTATRSITRGCRKIDSQGFVMGGPDDLYGALIKITVSES